MGSEEPTVKEILSVADVANESEMRCAEAFYSIAKLTKDEFEEVVRRARANLWQPRVTER